MLATTILCVARELSHGREEKSWFTLNFTNCFKKVMYVFVSFKICIQIKNIIVSQFFLNFNYSMQIWTLCTWCSLCFSISFHSFPIQFSYTEFSIKTLTGSLPVTVLLINYSYRSFRSSAIVENFYTLEHCYKCLERHSE